MGNLRSHRRIIGIAAFITVLLMSSCNSASIQTGNGSGNQNLPATASKTPFQPAQVTLFVSPGIPGEWRAAVDSIPDVNVVAEKNGADLSFTTDEINEGQTALFASTLVFAAAVPFMTVADDITGGEINALWNGDPGGGTYQTLIVSERTRLILSDQWGENGSHVVVVDEGSLLSAVESTEGAVAILAFDEIDPR